MIAKHLRELLQIHRPHKPAHTSNKSLILSGEVR